MIFISRRFIFTILFFVSSTAEAYIGPGAGLSALGSVIALIGGILLLIIGFLWYPLKRFFKKSKKGDASSIIDDTKK